MSLKNSQNTVKRRRLRIRKRVLGSVECPRLALHFSGKHLYAQCINDDKGETLAYLSTAVGKNSSEFKVNIESVSTFGHEFGKLASEKGIVRVVFDRGVKKYHGRVKAFADAVREEGIKF